jgi:hypothetical protein
VRPAAESRGRVVEFAAQMPQRRAAAVPQLHPLEVTPDARVGFTELSESVAWAMVERIFHQQQRRERARRSKCAIFRIRVFRACTRRQSRRATKHKEACECVAGS